MSDLRELYQQVILDHNKNPRNFREMEDATSRVDGYNPLCGDHYTVFLKTDGDTIAEVSFTGSGCAISKASASVMSSTVKGKSKEEAEHLFETFHRLVTGDASGLSASDLGRLAAFSGVSEFPARVKCATLAWHTLRSALEGSDEKVSTE
ncbi:MAG TPA: SUF system NifU family Fe-S cluster assembly protein [Thermoanaerobaculia bacterium]|jgi:nitrogen fixation NifU-like protein|nr:SUF system NifU family Fe-S cluster assembly protein [Thermoanaerobaculia bacterium]